MIELGVGFTPLHWSYWIGIGIVILINLLIGLNQYLHHNQKWLYLFMPIIFGVLIYVGYGLIGGMLQ